MQLPAGVNRRYAFLAGTLLAAIWIWVALDRPYTFPKHIPWNIYANEPQAPAKTGEDAFDFAPIESEAIKSICGETQWNSSLVFMCDESVGGIGNIRNSILNCVRYAIAAGGGFVVPSIIVRDASDISIIRTGIPTSMDYMFEPQHFIDSLQLSCPDLLVYKSIEDIPDYQNAHDALSLLPESVVPGRIPATGMKNPEQWKGLFFSWLEETMGPGEENPRPIVVKLARSYLQYPIYSDGEGFAMTFGGILKLRSDARRLATATLRKLAEVNSLTFDLSLDILPNAFFGVHLRTEKDSQDGWPVGDWVWSRYETQSKSYLEQAPRSGVSVIYVASGDRNEVAKFSKDAAAINMTVTTKFDLLDEADNKELQSLAWDQQALVDFMVMFKASDFGGVGHSSFAWNIALKRHQFAKERKHLDGPQLLSDELSLIYGYPRQYPEYAACLWP